MQGLPASVVVWAGVVNVKPKRDQAERQLFADEAREEIGLRLRRIFVQHDRIVRRRDGDGDVGRAVFDGRVVKQGEQLSVFVRDVVVAVGEVVGREDGDLGFRDFGGDVRGEGDKVRKHQVGERVVNDDREAHVSHVVVRSGERRSNRNFLIKHLLSSSGDCLCVVELINNPIYK